MKVKMTCRECGNNRFNFPEGGGDDAQVSCAECGHLLGSMGTLKEAVATAVITGDPVIDFGEGVSR